MVGTQERKIGNHTYAVTQFGALKGRQVLFRLTKVLGPLMAGMVKGGFSGEAIGTAVQLFSESAREEDFTWLCDAFTEVTKVKQPIQAQGAKELTLDLEKVFDNHFRGRYGEMVLWLAFAVEVNFSSFFGEIAKDAPGLAKLFAETPKGEGEGSE